MSHISITCMWQVDAVLENTASILSTTESPKRQFLLYRTPHRVTNWRMLLCISFSSLPLYTLAPCPRLVPWNHLSLRLRLSFLGAGVGGGGRTAWGVASTEPILTPALSLVPALTIPQSLVLG